MTLIGVFEIITGSRGAEDLGGPIRIAELSGDFWEKGIQSTLWFMMIISLNLGLINLFPIPMLDGGHSLLNFVEFINGKPLKQKYLELAHTFGFFILISLMIFATYNDISRFFLENMYLISLKLVTFFFFLKLYLVGAGTPASPSSSYDNDYYNKNNSKTNK